MTKKVSMSEGQFVGVVFAILVFGLIVAAITLCGCTPASKYAPGQQFGDGGATPCVNADGTAIINQPKCWLKPCE